SLGARFGRGSLWGLGNIAAFRRWGSRMLLLARTWLLWLCGESISPIGLRNRYLILSIARKSLSCPTLLAATPLTRLFVLRGWGARWGFPIGSSWKSSAISKRFSRTLSS